MTPVVRRFQAPIAMLVALSALAGCSASDLAALTAAPRAGGLTTFGGGSSAISGSASRIGETASVSPTVEKAAAAKPATGSGASATPLSAGSVDDNLGFPAFLTYLHSYDGPAMRALDVRERYVLRVVDASGKSVPSAELLVKDGDQLVYQARSYADGRQLFHPGVMGRKGGCYTVSAAKGGMAGGATFDCGQSKGDWVITLDGQAAAPKRDLQVLFMLDATGSMEGEIDRLQATISTIASRIADSAGQGATISFALVAYRDREDDWIVKKKNFTTDVEAFKATLGSVSADGGGDTPEDMEAALSASMAELSWSTGDATRLAFLVADAPPHVDYRDSVPYTQSALKAACQGVKLFTVGCSGLEVEGEYAMRQLSQLTLAKYMFVTRGGDEEDGGGPVSHTVASYSEKRLDDLVVETVRAELASLGK